LTTKLANLPESPGVYMFKDKDDKIIYVGKAKSINRVYITSARGRERADRAAPQEH
jgi:excinuclease ABC subunit C